MDQIKRGELVPLGDPVTALEQLIASTTEQLVRSLNAMRGLAGDSRPITEREVRAMGQLVAYEELLLAGRQFRIALTGLAYAGKTEVGSALARRLGHAYVNTGALGRALALVEQRVIEKDGQAPAPRALVKRAFDDGLALSAHEEAPFYRVLLGDEDVTTRIHALVHTERGAALLADDGLIHDLRGALEARHAAQGLVVEGRRALSLVSGKFRHFHLLAADDVRIARVLNHRPDVNDEAAARDVLATLDADTAEAAPDATVIDASSRPAASAALEILWHLLPAARRPALGRHALSGRQPLFAP